VFLTLIFIEITTRTILFFPTNINIFKYGLDKNIIIEIISLSKLQINISDRTVGYKKIQSNNNLNKDIINSWAFGGSTTNGYNCGDSSSWTNEIEKKNKKIKVKNLAFNGADSDQLIVILNIYLQKKEIPEIIFWASKFNMTNIFTKSNYRNKKILNYEFQDVKKNQIFLNVKRIDKTLKSYLILYNLLDALIIRLFPDKKIYQKKTHSDKDIMMMVKNFEINTTEAIEISRARGVKEFYIISLFSSEDFNQNMKSYKTNLYNLYLDKVMKKYPNYVKIIDLANNLTTNNKDTLLCDALHQTLKGNIYQASQINKFLQNNSIFFK